MSIGYLTRLETTYPGVIKPLFISVSQLIFSAEKPRSQKQKQMTNFSIGFLNVEKQASEEMN
jgi:hypothetical protein